MRVVELVVGGLLIVSGASIPTAWIAEVNEADDPVVGEVSLETAVYEGNATVRASDGAFLTTGAFSAQGSARRIDITVYEYRFVESYVQVENPFIYFDQTFGQKIEQETTHYSFDDVGLEIRGGSSGFLAVWPTNPNSVDFELETSSSKSTPIIASPTSGWITSHDMHFSHLVEAPIMALKHDDLDLDHPRAGHLRGIESGDTTFSAFGAHGDSMTVLENATLDVSHSGGNQTIALPKRENAVHAAPTLSMARWGYGVISVTEGNISLGFEDTQALLITKDPEWTIDGNITIETTEGEMSSETDRSKLESDLLEITGLATFRFGVDGEPDGHLQSGTKYLWPNTNPPEDPELNATFQTNSGDVSVNGMPFNSPVDDSSPLAEQATLLTKILGIGILLWGVAKTLILLVPGLAAEKPLRSARRRAIYKLLKTKGMIHLRELQRATGIPVGSLVYHLDILTRSELIASMRHGGVRVFFVPSQEFKREEVRRLAILADPTRRAISEVLVECRPVSQHMLSERLGISVASISRQMAVLEKEGLAERAGRRNRQYHAADLLKRWVNKHPLG